MLRRRGDEIAPERITAALRKADRDLDERFASIQGSDESAFWLEYDGMVLDQLGVDVQAVEVIEDLSEAMG